MIVRPEVTLLAYTQVTNQALELLSQDSDTTDLDHLAEVAGRSCYEAWGRKNPATAHNEGYLDNILTQGHGSVLEHSSATFYLTGVSRALLTELSRHRHLSFSVRSQRFVDEGQRSIVIPPALRGTPGEELLKMQADEAYDSYAELTHSLRDLPRKQAREAARAVLPNCTETRIVVT